MKQRGYAELAILAKDIKEKNIGCNSCFKSQDLMHYEIEADFLVDTFHSTDAGVSVSHYLQGRKDLSCGRPS